MARPKLWKLNPMDFTKMNPTRQAKIEAAPAKALPPTDSYVPNKIAKALHPGVQHLKVAKIQRETATANRYFMYRPSTVNISQRLTAKTIFYKGHKVIQRLL